MVGFGVDALTTTLERAGLDLVDQPAVYSRRPDELPVGGSALGLDRSNEVLVGGDSDEVVSRVLTGTRSVPSLADSQVVAELMFVAADAHAINASTSVPTTTRYPQFLAFVDTHTVLPNGNLDACLLLPYSSAADAERAAAMLTDEVAARGDELAHLADLDVTTNSIVMAVCQRDRADPDLFQRIFNQQLEFPAFE